MFLSEEAEMKVLAFNGSPRMNKGVTDSLVELFLEGAASAGAQTEKVYVAKHKINYCIGCFHCWFKHPGKCIHDDDMLMIRKKIKAADIVVAAVGVPKFVKGEWLKEGAVVIDVGINRMPDGKIVGDIDFDRAAERAGWISPVPGGVGPMTINTLILQSVEAAEKSL